MRFDITIHQREQVDHSITRLRWTTNHDPDDSLHFVASAGRRTVELTNLVSEIIVGALAVWAYETKLPVPIWPAGVLRMWVLSCRKAELAGATLASQRWQSTHHDPNLSKADRLRKHLLA